MLNYLNLNPRYEILPITEVVKEKQTPSRWDWEDIKRYNEMYIDDHAYDIPLKKCCMSNYNMVDWVALDLQFKEHNIYK